jgi:hypothetical protein
MTGTTYNYGAFATRPEQFYGALGPIFPFARMQSTGRSKQLPLAFSNSSPVLSKEEAGKILEEMWAKYSRPIGKWSREELYDRE